MGAWESDPMRNAQKERFDVDVLEVYGNGAVVLMSPARWRICSLPCPLVERMPWGVFFQRNLFSMVGF